MESNDSNILATFRLPYISANLFYIAISLLDICFQFVFFFAVLFYSKGQTLYTGFLNSNTTGFLSNGRFWFRHIAFGHQFCDSYNFCKKSSKRDAHPTSGVSRKKQIVRDFKQRLSGLMLFFHIGPSNDDQRDWPGRSSHVQRLGPCYVRFVGARIEFNVRDGFL